MYNKKPILQTETQFVDACFLSLVLIPSVVVIAGIVVEVFLLLLLLAVTATAAALHRTRRLCRTIKVVVS